MLKYVIRVLPFILASFILFTCAFKKTTKIAPVEIDDIPAGAKVTVVMTDSTALEFRGVDLKIDGEKFVGYSALSGKCDVDFDSIYSVTVERTDYTNTYFGAAAGIVAIGLIVGMSTAPSPPPSESCPFVYSYDGDRYVFDAEPYGGAICQALKRTEWCGLEFIEEVDGRYRIRIANELDETQYVDEIKLLVVDCPPGKMAVPDVSGRVFAVDSPAMPVKARDKNGNDVLPLVSANDRSVWRSRIEDHVVDETDELREELVFEFVKPPGASNCRLIVNANTTLWGSIIAKRLLELYGDKLQEWYNEVNGYGPAFERVLEWFYGEELYLLQLQVLTEDGWSAKGTIFSGGPMISDDKAYDVDLSDVEEDTLKIRLTPPVNFWQIDYIAVDFTEEAPVCVTEIEAVNAVDRDGADVRDLLSSDDEEYLVMPQIGESVEMVFVSPPKRENMSRSIILKASGYYDIHLEASGEPQTELLERMNREPGCTARFALQEYLKWREKRALLDDLK